MKPKCPECNSKMSKAGFAWSGRKKVQRFRCQACGRTVIKSEPDHTKNRVA